MVWGAGVGGGLAAESLGLSRVARRRSSPSPAPSQRISPTLTPLPRKPSFSQTSGQGPGGEEGPPH